MMPPRQHFPRIIDVIASAGGLLLLSPMLIVVGLLVRLTSPGPALHRARRVGRGGVEFTLYKFRSMRPDAATGSGITYAGDMRITAIGRWLRATKIDELPQLVNVLRGDMSLVGPRPEDPRYVRHYPVDLRPILHLTPGITSAASLVYANESALLAGADHERVYVEQILPDKLRIDLEWFTHASTLDNIGLIMRTVFRRPPATLALALLIVLVALPTGLDAQTVMLPLRHPAYEFLDRMEARYGTALLQFQRPLPRMEIARAIDALGRSTAELTTYDRQQIEFYRAEFSEELLRLHEADSTVSVSEDDRWNLLRIRSTTPARSFLAVDFVARAGLQKREDADDVFQRSSGIQAWGYVGSSLGAFMRWYDNGRTGVPYDPFAFRTPEQGIVRGPQSSPTSYEFEVAEAQFWYSNPWLVAGVQKGDVWLGSGRDGGIIFSDKAPSVPMVNYRIMITDWLAFEYFHAWLFSDILDTARTWAGQKFHETKYMASHAVTARPLPNLQATLGESIVYGGGDVNLLFLIPVISFRAADRWTRFTTGNAQFFADVRYTPMPGVTTYATGLIDEMDMGKALTGERTNFDYHVAYTVGALLTDLHLALVPLASETRIEFTRVYPYVYSNPNPTQQYTSHQVLLGHWIGANADLLTMQHVVHPARWLDAGITASFGRFADPHPAPLVTPRVQPAFLAKPQAGVRMLRANLRWTPLHDLWVKLDIAYTTLEKKAAYAGGPWVPGLAAGITASYGLH